MRQRRATGAFLLLLAALVAVVSSPPAAARCAGPTGGEDVLAQRYAPVVRLAGGATRCGRGEAFAPVPVDAVLGDPDVALRGPWRDAAPVSVAPDAARLGQGLPRYSLDLPGDALRPGCTYADWAAELQRRHRPTVYAHVATQPDRPGRLALQYWFFYVYNDFNDRHEGDWEMVQLDFDAGDVAQALRTRPTEIGYSQHEGAQRVPWRDGAGLTLVGGTHPVVHPALGSHANYPGADLYLGHSAAEGFGCDDTRDPGPATRPDVVVLPQDPAGARRAAPWLGFEGRWGERHRAFNDGPRGPATKPQWDAPFTWAQETWRDEAVTVPDPGPVGRGASAFFCAAVATGSAVVNRALADPSAVLGVLGLVVLVVAGAATRTSWRPAVPFRLRRRRPWGTLLTTAVRLVRDQPRLLLGIGLISVPFALVAALVKWLTLDRTGLTGLTGGTVDAVVALLADAVGAVLGLAALVLAQVAVASAVLALDEGRPVGAGAAVREALRRAGGVLGSLAGVVLAVTVLTVSVVGAPVAVWLAIRWSLLGPAAVLEPRERPLRASARVTRGRLGRTGSVVVVTTVLGLLVGPLTGTVLLLTTDAPLVLLDVVSAVLGVVLAPVAATVLVYLYADLDVRRRLEQPRPRPAVLPAEV